MNKWKIVRDILLSQNLEIEDRIYKNVQRTHKGFIKESQYFH
jgi:hypothetical protein